MQELISFINWEELRIWLLFLFGIIGGVITLSLIHIFILLDMNFRRDAISGQEGFDCLEQILKLDPQAIVLFMTAYADTDKAVPVSYTHLAIGFIPSVRWLG